MKPTLKLYDTIKTSRSFEGVPAGSVGAVLMIFDGGRIVEVEFVGDTEQMTYTVPAELCEAAPSTAPGSAGRRRGATRTGPTSIDYPVVSEGFG